MLAAIAATFCFAAPASAALHLSSIGDFSQPVYVTGPPGDPHRIFVVEQAGRIIEVRDGQIQSPAFLDITGNVKFGGDQGLLSMAFAPDYATSKRYYVYYTAARSGDGGGNVLVVEEFSPLGRRVVFTVDHPSIGIHNGGQLQFGPDGLLYAGTGDGSWPGNDPSNNAQSPTSRLGKMLRVNPLAAGAASPAIYASGLRNPWRFSFDRKTGDLIVGDVGLDRWEEVDFSPAGTLAGRNYGWACREGAHDTPGVSCTVPGAVDPVLEKDHTTTDFRALIGGYVVRDTGLPELLGRYVYGDNHDPAIRSVTLPAATDDAATGLTVDGLTSFGEDSCGHVYATSGGGPVYRIDGNSFAPCLALRLYARTTQRALRSGGFWARLTCNKPCRATVEGSFRIKGSAPYKLKPTTRLLAAGQTTQVTLHPWGRGMQAIRAALRRKQRVTAVLAVTASDAAENPSPERAQVHAIR